MTSKKLSSFSPNDVDVHFGKARSGKPFLPHRLAAACVAGVYSIVCVAFYLKLSKADHPANFLHTLLGSHDSVFIITSAFFLLTFGVCILAYRRMCPMPCYLIDFCCTKGDDRDRASAANFLSFLRGRTSVTDRNLKFQCKVFLRSGVGEEAYAPPALLKKGEDVDMHDAREESENLISDATRRLMQKTGIDPKEIDIVIINSSCFSPTPSLAGYVVNALSLRSNVKSYNLSGMGCSAGIISIDLAARLLKVHPNSCALVVSTENITSNIYFGNDRSMMVSNSLFRCGCLAALLTNKPSARTQAKMQLVHSLRTCITSDKAYGCVQHTEDSDGKRGVSLQTCLLEVAESALRMNITKLAPSILPWSEIMKVVISLARIKLLNKAKQAYQPDFKKAIDHFCIHPGGRLVIDAIGKGLKLSDDDVEPGKMALDRFGNTSSSGIWYALAYCEAKGRLKRGDKVWQIALGSGFKCNSGVWRVLRDIDPYENTVSNPWLSYIDQYPIPEHVFEARSARVKDIDIIFGDHPAQPNGVQN